MTWRWRLHDLTMEITWLDDGDYMTWRLRLHDLMITITLLDDQLCSYFGQHRTRNALPLHIMKYMKTESVTPSFFLAATYDGFSARGTNIHHWNIIHRHQPSIFRKCFKNIFGESRWWVVFSHLLAVFWLLEDALAFGALGNMPGAPTADLIMSPPTSTAAAPSVPSRNNGSSSTSSSSSGCCVGCLDGVPYSLVRMCLAQVTLLPTVLTKLTRTICLEVGAGSASQMSLPLIGGTLQF